MEAEHVIGLIEAAFPLQPLPQMSLHQAQLSNESLCREITEQEWHDAGEIDAGRTWKDFTEPNLITCDAALSHFDEEAFVYHLPAFLLFALRHCGVEWSHPAWSRVGDVVFSVTRRTPYTLSRYKKLSKAQREAVIAFLEYFAEHGRDSNASDAEKALKRYWKTAEASKPIIVIP